MEQLLTSQRELLSGLEEENEAIRAQISKEKSAERNRVLDKKYALALEMSYSEQLLLWTDEDDLFGNPFDLRQEK
ncbi:MAG: hypothetical protein H6773_02625 [Pseudomonadales bacterium]|nr:hypothetical protein [Candidatus Woesebacteria bacterium]MCB9801050.1 hypothetical protein [Pseudomonadales bacterium]